MDTVTFLERQYLAEEIEPISEGIADAIRKFTGTKLKAIIDKTKDAAENKNIGKINKISEMVPKAPVGEVESIAQKKIKNYAQKKKAAEKAARKVRIPSKIQRHITTFAAVAADTPENAQKAVEYIGTKIDWKTVLMNLTTGLIISAIVVLITTLQAGFVVPSVVVFVLSLDLIFLIWDIFTKREEVYVMTDEE
jgi:hypothetical protein